MTRIQAEYDAEMKALQEKYELHAYEKLRNGWIHTCQKLYIAPFETV